MTGSKTTPPLRWVASPSQNYPTALQKIFLIFLRYPFILGALWKESALHKNTVTMTRTCPDLSPLESSALITEPLRSPLLWYWCLNVTLKNRRASLTNKWLSRISLNSYEQACPLKPSQPFTAGWLEFSRFPLGSSSWKCVGFFSRKKKTTWSLHEARSPWWDSSFQIPSIPRF